MDPIRSALSEVLSVDSSEKLARFLSELRADVESGEFVVENRLSTEMLEAASVWVTGLEDFLSHEDVAIGEVSPWSIAAMVFSAALVYE